MQVSVETTSNIERRMTIGVPAQEIDQAVQKRLQETARTVKMNGFRPGKVPMRVVKRRFGDSVRQEIVGEVMRDNYIKALQEQELMKGAASARIDLGAADDQPAGQESTCC